MRITATIDDDVLAVARTLTDQSGSSLGGALSELAGRGFTVTGTTERDKVPVLHVDDDAPSVNSDHVHGALYDWA